MPEFWINMGPQHPMTHGLWNMKVKVDGETITDARPEIGYLHRGVEKIAEVREFQKVIVLTDRLCYVSSITWSHAYCLAVEKMMGVEVPERGKYLRVISLELQRIASHLMWLAAYGPDLGLLTVLLWSLRERELFLDLLQLMTGMRMNQNYPRIGGVRNDIPEKFDAMCKRSIEATSGIVPGIDRLAQEKVRPKLAISLNASNDEQRDAIMPINRKYPLAALLASCRRYPLRPWERLTFEYVLLGGVNDSPEDARRVVRLLNGTRAKVNLIPWNPGALPFQPPAAARVEEFRRILAEKNVPVFVRYSRGQDIYAACGQLAVIESVPSSSSQGPPREPVPADPPGQPRGF